MLRLCLCIYSALNISLVKSRSRSSIRALTQRSKPQQLRILQLLIHTKSLCLSDSFCLAFPIYCNLRCPPNLQFSTSQGSEEQGKKDMEAFSSVLDKVKSHPEVMEKVKEEVKSLAEVLHLRKHESKEKEPEAEENAKEGERTQNADESASANKTEDPKVLEQAAEEIQAVVAAVQQTERTETEIPIETPAETETPAEGEKPEEAKPEVEKDNPTKRIDFFRFFAMLFERFCSPADKKKD